MTIQDIVSLHEGDSVLSDRPLCQFITQDGARGICRFKISSDGIYLVFDKIIGFNKSEQYETALLDVDVTERLLEVLHGFLSSPVAAHNIFKSGQEVGLSELFSQNFLTENPISGFGPITFKI